MAKRRIEKEEITTVVITLVATVDGLSESLGSSSRCFYDRTMVLVINWLVVLKLFVPWRYGRRFKEISDVLRTVYSLSGYRTFRKFRYLTRYRFFRGLELRTCPANEIPSVTRRPVLLAGYAFYVVCHIFHVLFYSVSLYNKETRNKTSINSKV